MLGKNCKMYKMWKSEWKRFETVPFELEVVNLGSSGDANNFDYTLWNARGFNLASSPQDMYYDNQILEQYGDHLKKGAIVIICLSEFALIVDKYEADYQNYKYYGYVESNRIPNYSLLKKRLIQYCPGLLDRRCIKMEIKECVKRILKWEENKKTDQTTLLSKRAQKAMKIWADEFGWSNGIEITREQHAAIKRSWAILMKDIDYCKEKDLIPIILIPPFNRHLKDQLPDDILSECLWKYVKRLSEFGIKIISFWDDEELEADKYYSTLACLNTEGKQLFNKKVEEKIWGRR